MLSIDKGGHNLLTLQNLCSIMKEEKEFNISYLAGHATTIISVTLVLLLVGIIAVCSLGARRETRKMRESVQLSVIMTDATTDEEANRCLDTIANYPFVRDPRLITKEEALYQWKEETGEDLEAVFGVNPLSPEIEFSLPENYSNPDSIAQISSRLKLMHGVEEVAAPDAGMVEAMNHNIEAMSIVLGIIAIVMLVISFVLINNTVRLSIYSRRFTIHTMQLVGATGAFISRPVVVRNLIAGILSGALAVGILAVAIAGAPHYAGIEITPFISWKDFGWIALGLGAGGAFICSLAAWLATGRYLRKDYSELFK